MNRPKGNHKHLTLSQRIEIEKGLLANHSFTDIAASLGKDPTTISKEIRRHSETKRRTASLPYRVKTEKPARSGGSALGTAAYCASSAGNQTRSVLIDATNMNRSNAQNS